MSSLTKCLSFLGRSLRAQYRYGYFTPLAYFLNFSSILHVQRLEDFKTIDIRSSLVPFAGVSRDRCAGCLKLNADDQALRQQYEEAKKHLTTDILRALPNLALRELRDGKVEDAIGHLQELLDFTGEPDQFHQHEQLSVSAKVRSICAQQNIATLRFMQVREGLITPDKKAEQKLESARVAYKDALAWARANGENGMARYLEENRDYIRWHIARTNIDVGDEQPAARPTGSTLTHS